MKKALAVLIALIVMSCGAMAEERPFALNGEQGSDVYSWDGTQLTVSGNYLYIYSITDGKSGPDGELFAAQSANQTLPEGDDYASPRYAILDAKGQQLTDFLYDSLEYDADNDVIYYTIDGLYGAMSRSLEELVPCEYDSVASDGTGGFLMVRHSDASAPPILRMAKGASPKPTGIRARFYWSGFSEGLCPASAENGLYGFLNSQGKWAIKPKFDWVQNFNGGYAIAREKNKTGVIDETGRWAIKPSYDDDRGMLPDGSAAILLRGTQAFVLRPSDGKQLFSVKLSKDGYVSTSYDKPIFTVTDKRKTTLYKSDGTKVLSLSDSYSFDLWSTQPGDRLLASSANDSILIDLSGITIFKSQSLTYLDTVEGKALYLTARFKTHSVTYEGSSGPTTEPIYSTFRYGIVDSDGQQVLPTVYSTLYSLVPGRYYAEDARFRGVIDASGHWIVSESLYDQLTD